MVCHHRQMNDVLPGARTRGGAWEGFSQPLKLAPRLKHDGRSSATYELPQKIFVCWRFSHSRADAAISRTLALLNSAGTNFTNYLLKVKIRTEWGKFAASVALELKGFQLPWTPLGAPPPDPRYRLALPRSPRPGLKTPKTWYSGLAPVLSDQLY